MRGYLSAFVCNATRVRAGRRLPCLVMSCKNDAPPCFPIKRERGFIDFGVRTI